MIGDNEENGATQPRCDEVVRWGQFRDVAQRCRHQVNKVNGGIGLLCAPGSPITVPWLSLWLSLAVLHLSFANLLIYHDTLILLALDSLLDLKKYF